MATWGTLMIDVNAVPPITPITPKLAIENEPACRSPKDEFLSRARALISPSFLVSRKTPLAHFLDEPELCEIGREHGRQKRARTGCVGHGRSAAKCTLYVFQNVRFENSLFWAATSDLAEINPSSRAK